MPESNSPPLEKTLERIAIARGKALTPGKEGDLARRGFASLGVSSEMLRTQSAAQLFMGPISQAVKGGSVENLMPVFKKLEISGRELGAVFPALKTDFDGLQAKMERYGALLDAETVVKLRHVGDEFDLVAKIIVGTLGPALVALGDWALRIIATKDSFLSRVLEGMDYAGRTAAGMSKLSDFEASNGTVWSAKTRADSAAMILDEVNKVERAGRPITDIDYLQAHRQPGGMFEDFKGGNYNELNRYLTGLITPVQDVRTAAAKGAEGDMQGVRDSIAEWQARMKAEAERLNKPTPPDKFEPPPPSNLHAPPKLPEDSLVRIGNFLGGSQGAMMRLAEQRTAYLRISRNMSGGRDRRQAPASAAA